MCIRTLLFLFELMNGNCITYTDLSFAFVQKILTEINIIVPLPVGGESLQRLFTTECIILVGSRDCASCAGLHPEKLYAVYTEMPHPIFIECLTTRKNNIWPETVYRQWFGEAGIQIIERRLTDQQKRVAI